MNLLFDLYITIFLSLKIIATKTRRLKVSQKILVKLSDLVTWWHFSLIIYLNANTDSLNISETVG